VYDQFAELVAARVAALKVGDGAAADTTHGPLISPAGVEKVSSDAAAADVYCLV
jgi:succinate-semialdehyde dehydrogenase/glutarate-semialdehyde dehydrogenase